MLAQGREDGAECLPARPAVNQQRQAPCEFTAVQWGPV